jgi:transposase InsO family protein
MDPSKLVLPIITWDGKKETFPTFERRVMSAAMAFKFGHFLTLQKEVAIAALATELTAAGGDDEKSADATAKAMAWYDIAAPVVSSWLEGAVPELYKTLLLPAPIGDAFATWTIIVTKARTTTKREARWYKKCLRELRMQGGVTLEVLISKILLLSAILLGCGDPVSDQDQLEVLLEGVTAPYFVAKAILESKESTTFDEAVTAFTAVSNDIARRRTHEKAHHVSTKSTPRKRHNRKEPTVFCPHCFAERQVKHPHLAADCWRKHGYPEGHPRRREANFTKIEDPDEEKAFFAHSVFGMPDEPASEVLPNSEKVFDGPASGEYDIFPPGPKPDVVLPPPESTPPADSTGIITGLVFFLLFFACSALGQDAISSIFVATGSVLFQGIVGQVGHFAGKFYDAVSPTLTMARNAFSISIGEVFPSRPSGRIFVRSAVSSILTALLILLVMATVFPSAKGDTTTLSNGITAPWGSDISEHAFAVNQACYNGLTSESWNSEYSRSLGSRWIIDSGCSSHMARFRRFFGTQPLLPSDTSVHLANDFKCKAEGRGNASARVRRPHGKSRLFGINQCLLVPELQHNLLSVRQLDDEGYKVIFHRGRCTIARGNDVCATGTLEGGQYYLDTVPYAHEANQADLSPSNSTELWHARLGHVHAPAVKSAVRNKNISGVAISSEPFFCKACSIAKIHKSKFPTCGGTRADQPFDLVHSDLAGPVSTPSIGGSHYLMSLIDDCTRYVYIYCIAHKSDAFDTYVGFENLHTGDYGGVGTLRTDNGGEYTSLAFKAHLSGNGTFAQRTTPDTPQQNGVAERMNRTIFEMANAMMVHASVPTRFWAEAVNTSGYVRNRCPTAALDGKTPFEALTGNVPDLSHMRIFGCEAYALIPGRHKKFDPKGTRCVFLGYSSEAKCYRLWDLEAKKVLRRRDVRFNETCFPFESPAGESASPFPPGDSQRTWFPSPPPPPPLLRQ